MKDKVLLLVVAEVNTALPHLGDAVAEIRTDSACLIPDSANVEVLSTKIIGFETYKNEAGFFLDLLKP